MNSTTGEIHAGFPNNTTDFNELSEAGQSGQPVTTHDNRGPTRLSEVLGATNDNPSLGDRFFDIAFRAARQAGCELLFEIPSVLFREENSRVAAIRGHGEGAGDAELFYVLFSERKGAVSIVNANEVHDSVVEFTRSYAGVLNLMRGDRQLVTPLIQ